MDVSTFLEGEIILIGLTEARIWDNATGNFMIIMVVLSNLQRKSI